VDPPGGFRGRWLGGKQRTGVHCSVLGTEMHKSIHKSTVSRATYPGPWDRSTKSVGMGKILQTVTTTTDFGGSVKKRFGGGLGEWEDEGMLAWHLWSPAQNHRRWARFMRYLQRVNLGCPTNFDIYCGYDSRFMDYRRSRVCLAACGFHIELRKHISLSNSYHPVDILHRESPLRFTLALTFFLLDVMT
jgi:hypothetical protein